MDGKARALSALKAEEKQFREESVGVWQPFFEGVSPRSCSRRHSSGIFPQELWKTLWKSGSQKLQVPENFILLAFCTRARQIFQNSHEGRFCSDKTTVASHACTLFRLLPLLGLPAGARFALMRQAAAPVPSCERPNQAGCSCQRLFHQPQHGFN